VECLGPARIACPGPEPDRGLLGTPDPDPTMPLATLRPATICSSWVIERAHNGQHSRQIACPSDRSAFATVTRSAVRPRPSLHSLGVEVFGRLDSLMLLTPGEEAGIGGGVRKFGRDRARPVFIGDDAD
jgi:hypothetical protein